MTSINQVNEIKENMNLPNISICVCLPVIDFTTIRFHNDKIPTPIKIFNENEADYKFGIIEIKIHTEIPITSKHIHLFFNIDASGSMSDICSNGRSKMAHIHHTLENMLRIFHEKKECNISIHLQAFDNSIKTIISNVPDIRESDIEFLTHLVRKIRPGGSTNIELALQKAKENLMDYYTINPEHEIVHIFLTDGDITDGSRNYETLLELVPKNCSNIFIGYGTNHDSKLLSHLSSKKGDDYRFIDAFEKAGLVYGEVIHGILYKAIEDVTLTAHNGELYDYQTNTWKNSIEIGNLLSEQMKIYHIRSKEIYNCYVNVYGKTILKTSQFQNVDIYETQACIIPNRNLPSIDNMNKNITNDLSIYMFRQLTQELLYKARKISEKFNNINPSILPLKSNDSKNNGELNIENIIEAINEEKRNIKKELNEFHKNMIHFMKEKELENNPILKMLCDDIYIAYKTTGTLFGTMYTCARQTSNGRQQTYMCSTLYTDQEYNDLYQSPCNNSVFPIIRRMGLQRQTNLPMVNFSNELTMDVPEDDDIDNYMPSKDFLSPFSSDGVVTLMREVSGIPSIGRIHTLTNEEEY